MKRTYAEWKVRVGSPRELYWELQQFLEKEGYVSFKKYEPLALEHTPIEGHATFNNSLQGQKSTFKSTPWRFILAIILFFTIILIPVSLWLIRKSSYELIQQVLICIEGETFRASAHSQDSNQPRLEVLGTVSNARITLEGTILRERGDGKVKNPNEVESLAFNTNLSQMRGKLEQLLPKMQLPETY